MSEPVFGFSDQDPAMQEAYAAAQRSFKYFWRELSWEQRRIVPGLDMAMVKLSFTDGPRTDDNPEWEQMWIGQVDFDGETLSGELVNSPNWLTSVRQGDHIQAPFSELRDWLITVDKKAYGAFTVNAMRAGMDRTERKEHDHAWGLDFGDPASARIEINRGGDSKPGLFGGLFGSSKKSTDREPAFEDHPMCVNMIEKIDAQLAGDPSVARNVDEAGWTLLHRDALAGNMGVVQLLIQHGADATARTPSGRTAAELARGIGWTEIADYLDGLPAA